MWGQVAMAGASVLGGILGGRSASKAARQQAAAMDRATEEQRRQFEQTRTDYQPFRDYGQGGIAALSNPRANFYASPDYEFRRDEGERNIGASFAARGGAFSGNAMKALAQYNSNLASGEYNNWYARQSARIDQGLGATGSVAAAGQNMSNNVSNLMVGQGAVRAAGTEARSNALLGGVNNALNLYAMGRQGSVSRGAPIPRMAAAYVPNTRGYA